MHLALLGIRPPPAKSPHPHRYGFSARRSPNLSLARVYFFHNTIIHDFARFFNTFAQIPDRLSRPAPSYRGEPPVRFRGRAARQAHSAP